MSKGNAEKFIALYQQHKAIAKRLAEINAKSEDVLPEPANAGALAAEAFRARLQFALWLKPVTQTIESFADFSNKAQS